MFIFKKLYLPYHTYTISHQQLFSQIFSVNPGICPHQVSMQHLIHHSSAQDVAHHLKTIKLFLKKVQYFFG